MHTRSEAVSSMGGGQIILPSQKYELIQEEETASSGTDFKQKESCLGWWGVVGSVLCDAAEQSHV